MKIDAQVFKKVLVSLNGCSSISTCSDPSVVLSCNGEDGLHVSAEFGCMDYIIRHSISGYGEQFDQCEINYKRLKAVVSGIEGQVDLDFRDNKLILKSEFNHEIKACKPENVREFKFEMKDTPVEFDSLPDIMRTLVKFAAKDDPHVLLNGIYFDNDGKKIVATDGHRMSITECPIKTPNAIVPRVACAALSKVKSPVQCKFGTGRAYFRYGDVEAIARYIPGEYPDYNRVIPKDSGVKVAIDGGKLQRFIKSSKAYLGRDGGIKLYSEGAAMKAKASCPDLGDAERDLGDSNGIEIDIGLQASYLNEYLEKDTELEFSYYGELSPITIEKDGFLHVLMPVRIS